MIARREAINEWLGAIAVGAGYCAFWAVPFFAVMYGTAYAVLGFLLVPAFVMMAMVRKKAKQFGLFVLFHALIAATAMTVVFLLAGFSTGLFVALIQMVMFAVISFSKRFNHKGDVPDVATIVFLGGGCFAGWLILRFIFEVNAEAWQMLGFGFLVLSYFVCRHIASVNEAVNTAERITNQPTDNILRFNNRIGAMALMFVLVCMLLAPVIRLDKVLLFLFSILLYLFDLIGRLFAMVMSGSSGDGADSELNGGFDSITDEPDAMGAGSLSEIFGVQEREPLPVTELMQTIAVGVLVVGLIAFAVFMVIDMYRKFSNLAPAGASKDSRKRLSFSQDAAVAVTRGGLRGMVEQVFGASVSMKVRRIFYKKVTEYGKKKAVSVSASETSAQISGKLAPYEDLDRLHTLYDKARYSEGGVSKDEWQSLR